MKKTKKKLLNFLKKQRGFKIQQVIITDKWKYLFIFLFFQAIHYLIDNYENGRGCVKNMQKAYQLYGSSFINRSILSKSKIKKIDLLFIMINK